MGWVHLFYLGIILALPIVTLQGPHEKKLLHDLMSKYNVLERPVANESEALTVSFGLTLQQIIDVDEKNQLLITNIWLKLEWEDYNLRWNSTEYGEIKDLRIPPQKIWTPDVLMYNSADEGFDGTYPTNVVVRDNGGCLYVPPGIFKSTCKIDITWFPFDDQKCSMKFGSWTYGGAQLDLVMQNETGDITDYIDNGEWDLLSVPGKRNVISYACCPETYIDITFTIHIRRRTLYYCTNLIVPCVLISSMTLLGFTLPPDSGEKLTLGVTILLSLTVFLNMVAEKMPETSEAVPLIGTYFNCIMFMVASSVVLTVVILNYHHRSAATHDMPSWVRTIFLQWLPWLLCMSRPGKKISIKSIIRSNKMRELEMRERSSKSLLANVLDMEDDFRPGLGMIGVPQRPAGSGSLHRIPEGGSLHRHHFFPNPNHPHSTSNSPHSCLSATRELQLILKELRMITDKMRKDDEDSEVTSDWKFAAMVVDRVCLIIFTLFTITATIVVLLSAPHIIVT